MMLFETFYVYFMRTIQLVYLVQQVLLLLCPFLVFIFEIFNFNLEVLDILLQLPNSLVLFLPFVLKATVDLLLV
jgi:hypothetical protein